MKKLFPGQCSDLENLELTSISLNDAESLVYTVLDISLLPVIIHIVGQHNFQARYSENWQHKSIWYIHV